MNNVLNHLQSIQAFPPGLKERLQKIIRKKEVSRKEYLLEAGHTCRDIYFIEKGIFRCYYLKDGVEVCSWFMKEKDVCIAVKSFYRQQPSVEYIQALEDSVVYCISFEDLQRLYRDFPSFNFTGRVLTEHYYMLSEDRSSSIRMLRAHERYAWLMEHFPELLLRVPAKYIASYLGMTEVTLSVIRGRK